MQTIFANVMQNDVNAYTIGQGKRGVGIKNIEARGANIVFTLDDNKEFSVPMPWLWFGTLAEYNALTDEERNSYCIHFIEEGS